MNITVLQCPVCREVKCGIIPCIYFLDKRDRKNININKLIFTALLALCISEWSKVPCVPKGPAVKKVAGREHHHGYRKQKVGKKKGDDREDGRRLQWRKFRDRMIGFIFSF